MCPQHWAEESAELVCTYSYTDEDGNHIESGFDLGGQGDGYYTRVLPVIESQIQKAGVRMAAVFNANFGGNGANE